MMPDTGQHIQQLTIFGPRVTDSIGGKAGKVQTSSNSHGGLVSEFFLPVKMPLQLHVDIGRTKDLNQALRFAFCSLITATCKSRSQRPFRTTSQTDESFGMGLKLFPRCASFSLGFFPQFVLCDKTTQVLITFGSFYQ